MAGLKRRAAHDEALRKADHTRLLQACRPHGTSLEAHSRQLTRNRVHALISTPLPGFKLGCIGQQQQW